MCVGASRGRDDDDEDQDKGGGGGKKPRWIMLIVN